MRPKKPPPNYSEIARPVEATKTDHITVTRFFNRMQPDLQKLQAEELTRDAVAAVWDSVPDEEKRTYAADMRKFTSDDPRVRCILALRDFAIDLINKHQEKQKDTTARMQSIQKVERASKAIPVEKPREAMMNAIRLYAARHPRQSITAIATNMRTTSYYVKKSLAEKSKK